jgi:ABC-type sugar transport system ATPase subunit
MMVNGGETLLELQGIVKVYGLVRVLDDVSLKLNAGEIHAVVGENGAGKSTLVRIAAGLVHPDRGSVVVGGNSIRSASPRAAQSAGIGIVTQELTAVPARTVLENVFLGMRVVGLGKLHRSPTARAYDRICEASGFWLPPDAVVRDLSIADQQILEVLRCLAREPRVVILDEPTASLDGLQAAKLLELLRRLCDEGAAVMFVSHHLKEVLAVADVVTILRDGVLVDTEPVAQESEESLIRKMVGRPLDMQFVPKRLPELDAKTAFEAKDIWLGTMVQGISLRIKQGEIVGLSGLVGSGRSEFARCLVGAERCDQGTVQIAGGEPLRPRHPHEIIAKGLVMVPEDRKGQGLILRRSVEENLASSRLKEIGHFGFVFPKALANRAQRWMASADIRPRDSSLNVGVLSGGNQQKVLLAKWLSCQPKVLIVDEPTRGVDVGAKRAIHEMIAAAAASGIGVLLISSELEELMGLAHRILVIRKGKITSEFEGAFDSEQIMAAAFGTSSNKVIQ